jgi:histone deacetylase 1/2
MENANSHDYLHKIKSTVIENIRRTGRPSVEAFTNIPPGLNRRAESDAEDEEDDIDADLNRDVRMTQRQRDKEITRDNELYDESEDEDYKNSLGVRAQPGVKKRRNITDFPNPNAASVQDIDAMNGTEEINDESAVSTRQPSAAVKSRTQTPAAGEQSADEDGDVEMDEPDAPVATATSTRSQSPAGVVTPPESPPATAAAAALAPTSAPAADIAMEGADEDTKEAIAEAKAEGQSERDTENVKGEVRTEVAKD